MEDGCTVCDKATISLDNIKVCFILKWNLFSERFLRHIPIRWAIKQCSVSVILTSSVQYDSSAAGYGELCVCGFTQSEMGKYFEWVIIIIL